MTSVATSTRKPTVRLSTAALPAVRHPSRMIIGVIVLLLCAMQTAAVYSRIGDRQSVLALARPVEEGHVITNADLKATRIAVDSGVRTVPVGQRGDVVGRVATARLVPDSILNPQLITNSAALPPGKATVGASLKPGQFPAGMHTGDPVLLVATPSNDAAAAPPVNAAVSSVQGATDQSGTTSASFVVDQESAAAIATAGAGGNLVAVVLPR